MSSGTRLLPSQIAVADSAERGKSAEQRVQWQRRARRVAVFAAIVCAILVVYPALAAPITADDRYWYLWSAVRSHGSFPTLIDWTFEHTRSRIGWGRLNFVTELERRVSGFGIIETSVATSTPITVYLGLFKLLLLGGGMATVLAFVRSLRWRASDGTLVRARRRTLVLVTVAGTLAVAIGVQAQLEDRNGWTAYPVSTYGAVISIFGSVALLLWLSRLVAEGSKRMLVIAVVVLALLGITTNFRYELVFPAVPIAAVALLVVPVTARANRAAGRRAKVVTSLAYFGSFIPVFIASRLYLAHVCETHDCYSGIQPDPGFAAVRTTIFNLLSTTPVFGRNEFLGDLRKVGWEDRYSVMPTWWSVLVGLVAIGAMLMLWWGMQGERPPATDSNATTTSREAQRRAEAMLLTVGAGLSLLVALGTAAVMGLSTQSHEIISQPGIPYRNAVVGWFGLAFCLVLLVAAFGVIASPRGALVTWTALAAVIGIVAALYLPANLMALRVSRVTHALTEDVNWEVVKGDTTPEGNARRCELTAEMGRSPSPAVQRMRPFPNSAFQLYTGQPFCMDSAGNPVYPSK